MFFAHRAALLRVKGDGKQSAVNPVREGTWKRSDQAETGFPITVMTGASLIKKT